MRPFMILILFKTMLLLEMVMVELFSLLVRMLWFLELILRWVSQVMVDSSTLKVTILILLIPISSSQKLIIMVVQFMLEEQIPQLNILTLRWAMQQMVVQSTLRVILQEFQHPISHWLLLKSQEEQYMYLVMMQAFQVPTLIKLLLVRKVVQSMLMEMMWILPIPTLSLSMLLMVVQYTLKVMTRILQNPTSLMFMQIKMVV